jgi:APA family basic amino acid/polyamine antiporter
MDLKTTSKEFASPDNFGIVDPEMATVTEPRSVKSRTPRRTIGFVTASSIVIANIIGTGIFTSLGFQLADIQSGFPLLMLWIIGGIAAFAARFVTANSAPRCRAPEVNIIFYRRSIIPRSDSWRDSFPLPLGLLRQSRLAAMAFGKYFVGVFGVGSPVLLSFVVVWVVTAFHLGNLQIGSVFQNLSTLVKLLLIGALIAAGLFVQTKQPISFLPAPAMRSRSFGGPFAVALVYVMYSYSGWNAAAYITGEIKKPEKNVPRSLLAGQALVIVIYVLLNAVFLATTPVQELKGQIEVALIAGNTFLGTNGGRVAGAVICLGLVLRNQLNDMGRAACHNVDGRRSWLLRTV